MSGLMRSASPGGRVPRTATGVASPTIVVSSLKSDAHTWNLVFLQLLIEEAGFEVVNLGPCVPTDLLVSASLELLPRAIVLSSVNGHGYHDALPAIAALRARPALAGTPVIIGGKLGVGAEDRSALAEHLLASGFDAVYDDTQETGGFRELLAAMTAPPS
jgi:methylaspartate mutase sigma subunit